MEHDPYNETPKADRGLKKQQVDDIRGLMSTVSGRRVVWRLLEKAGIYRTSFTGTNETFFNEGMRNVGLFLLSEVMAYSPDDYFLMMKEART